MLVCKLNMVGERCRSALQLTHGPDSTGFTSPGMWSAEGNMVTWEYLWRYKEHASHKNLSWLQSWVGRVHDAVEDTNHSILDWVVVSIVL